MAELRYNPVSREWVMVASHRQARPQMPKDWCPFCPGSGKVPDSGYETLRYLNDFPALSQQPPPPDGVAGPLFEVKPAYGRCEVLLYSDQHRAALKDLSDAHVHKLAALWRDCYLDMAADPGIEYVFLFENRGEAVGVTMPHPHGQAYGYSFLPQKVRQELDGAQAYHAEHDRCLFCDLLSAERADGRRVLFENEAFCAYVPFFSPLTYGLHVTPRRHVAHLGQMTARELDLLGETLRDCAGLYDSLFDMPFPYMMCMYNAPPRGNADAFHHFHVKFFPPLRAKTTQQFFASSETGAGAWCNPNCPEGKAQDLREAYDRYKAESRCAR
ncbi:MAG: galactose-1-phosphate uridylyltransferase [Oscillospiraceae bacterium]|jgi:UDPglucose--hexose-1-phosphate uridylyltransferase|nr:galactose-1-phosphate uridylyltransferase [Oscillospiraceae bacterium]